MNLKKKVKVVTVGTFITLANIYPYSVDHTSAEEISIVENSLQLKSLFISEVQLNQPFSPDVSSYTANVANEIDRMSLQFETMDESSAVTINGESVESGNETILNLDTGENIFYIVVTNGTDTNTYTITVMRAQNDNNQLANLTLTSGKLSFDPNVTLYEVKVDSEINTVTIKPEVAANTSTVKINGTVVGEEGFTMELPVGISTVSIIVTAEDGAERTYQITFTRTEEKNNSNENTGKQPSQNTDSNSELIERPIQNTDSNSNQTQRPDLPQQSQNNRTTSTLSGGGGFDTEVVKQTKANLTSLTVSDGTWNKSFSQDVYTYHIEVENNISSVTISGSPEESDAKLTIEGIEATNSSTVAIGNTSKTVISVAVTYENDRKTYVLIFDKNISEEETGNEVEDESGTMGEDNNAETPSTDEVSTQPERGPNRTEMNAGFEQSAETTSFWQKILSFFGF